MADKRAAESKSRPNDLESRLLLMTAKHKFDREQLSEVRALTDEISDWNSVAETAMRKFSAPFLLRALRDSESESVPAQIIQRLADHTKLTNLRVLKIAAAQTTFHKTCIEPIKARHAYAKGIALSLQFNANFAQRFCRDVDILVEKKQISKIVKIAVENNYRVVVSTSPLRFAETPSDLKFMASFPSDVGLISPDGVLIEVHRRLDKKDFIFDVDDALDTAEPVQLGGLSMNTLRPSLHFTYVCYHHSRHLWSHLHWLADLDLMLQSKKLDPARIQQTSERVGLTPTTNASIALHQLITHPTTSRETSSKPGLAGEFLSACRSNLSGGLELEYELRQKSFGHDLMSKSQVSPGRLKATRDTFWRNRFNPVLEQYQKRPLHHSLFWLYRVQRALVVFRDTLLSPFKEKQARRERTKPDAKDQCEDEQKKS